jgi:hypothetical protein
MTNPHLDKFLKRRNLCRNSPSNLHGGANPNDITEETRKKSVLSKVVNAPRKIVKGISDTSGKIVKGISDTSNKIVSDISDTTTKIARSGKETLKGIDNSMRGTTEERVNIRKLSQKITDSIKRAFANIKLKEQLKEIDLQKVAKLVIEKPVNLNFGGGFLIFGPDLQICSMIHIFNKDNQPFYFEKQFTSNIESNTINDGVKSEQKYTVTQNVKSIIDIINNKPKTS